MSLSILNAYYKQTKALKADSTPTLIAPYVKS